MPSWSASFVLAVFLTVPTITRCSRVLEDGSRSQASHSAVPLFERAFFAPTSGGYGRLLLSDDDDRDDEKPRRRPPLRRRIRRRRRRGSASFARLRGVLRIVVYGDGESCFVKIFQRGMTYKEQFGETTSASAFIDLYGHGECAPGAKGIAYGFAKAKVIAEAKSIGSKCETKVITEVITRTRDVDPNDGVDVVVKAAAGGDALALCD